MGSSKAGSILLLISGILSLIGGIIGLTFGLFAAFYGAGSDGWNIFLLLIFFVIIVLLFVAGFLKLHASKMMKIPVRTTNGGILALVVGIIGMDILAIIGGILGIIEGGK